MVLVLFPDNFNGHVSIKFGCKGWIFLVTGSWLIHNLADTKVFDHSPNTKYPFRPRGSCGKLCVLAISEKSDERTESRASNEPSS